MGMGQRGTLEKDLVQGFSHCNVHTDLLQIMLKCKS